MKNSASLPRPNIAALEAFMAVARLGSFRRAAAERGISASAMSHVVRGLEDSLAMRLFNRTSRSVSLTEAGRYLTERIGPALRDVTDGLSDVRAFRDRPSGLLRLNVPRIATALIVEPIIGQFLAAYPDIRLEIASSDGLVDIVAEGFDAGIRRDRRLAPGMIALPVGSPRRFAVVGSPAYFAQCDRPATPYDLSRHRCIERRFPNRARYAWEFKRHEEELEIEVSGPLIVDDTALMLRAALDGAGLAFMFESLVADHLASGALLRVLDEWCEVEPRFFLYYPGRRQVPPTLRVFIDMVRKIS